MADDIQYDPDTGAPIFSTPQISYDPDTGAPIFSASSAQAQPQAAAPAPAQNDWWADYWGPLKDNASRAYYDSTSGNAASMQQTDPFTARDLLSKRTDLQQQIFEGSAPDSDGESKQQAALAAQRLAK